MKYLYNRITIIATLLFVMLGYQILPARMYRTGQSSGTSDDSFCKKRFSSIPGGR